MRKHFFGNKIEKLIMIGMSAVMLLSAPITAYAEGEENQQESCIDDQRPNSTFNMDALLHKIQDNGDGKIHESRFQIIRNRGFLLPNEIG